MIAPIPHRPAVDTWLLTAVIAVAIALVVLLLARTIDPAVPNVMPANTVRPAATSTAAPVPKVEPQAAPAQNIQPSAAPQTTADPTAAPIASPRLTTPPLSSPRATIAPPQPTANGAGALQGPGNAGPNGPAALDQDGPRQVDSDPAPGKVILPKGSMGQ